MKTVLKRNTDGLLTKITYADLGRLVLELMNGEPIPQEVLDLMRDKAEALIRAHDKKKGAGKAKGEDPAPVIGEKTAANLEILLAHLEEGEQNAKTIAELDCGLNAIQITSAMKWDERIKKTKKVQDVVDNKGMIQQKLYVAYYLSE